MPTLADVIATLHAGDTSQPLVTCYDRTGGPTDGERVELSSRVLLNWAAKAAGALQDEMLVEPGTRVGLGLPAHWRAAYWALACWWVGATVVTGPAAAQADVLVTDSSALAAEHAGDTVLVTLAALARRAEAPVPAGAMDEARELATYPDRFVPLAAPGPQAPAWESSTGTVAYDAALQGSPARVGLATSDVEELLHRLADAAVAAGSVVLVRSAAETPLAGLDALWASEHAVTPGD